MAWADIIAWWGKIQWDQTLAGLVGVAAVVQAVAAAAMMRGLKHSADTLRLTESSSQRQLRAYIDFGRAELIDMKGSGDVTLQVTCKNSGATRAVNVEATFRWVVLSPDETFPPEPVCHEDGARAVVGAGGDLQQFCRFERAAWNTMYPDFVAGRLALIVDGRVDYEDVFEKPWSTRYRRQYDPTNHSTVLRACREGNTST